MTDKFTINKTILHPSDKIARLPLVHWVRKILNSLATINFSPISAKQIDNFAVIVNQAALIFTYYGKTHSAREVCLKSIDFYSRIFKKFPYAEILTYQMQSWINIARLERILKQYDAALDKFFLLLDLQHTSNVTEQKDEINIREMIIKTLAMLESDPSKNVLANVPIIEIIKTYMEMEQYEKLLESFPISKVTPHNYVTSFISEAQIIALTKVEQMNQASQLLSFTDQSSLFLYKKIFEYRHLEIAYLLHDKPSVDKWLSLLKTRLLHDAEKKTDLNHLFFGLECAHLLLKITDFAAAHSLYKECYLNFLTVQDEIGQFLCLSQLAKQNILSYQEQLNTLLFKTQYTHIKKERLPISQEETQLFSDLLNKIMFKFLCH